MQSIFKNEKIILITLISLLFILSAGLIYLMIKKDILIEETGRRWLSLPNETTKTENSWPKVEIQTSK